MWREAGAGASEKTRPWTQREETQYHAHVAWSTNTNALKQDVKDVKDEGDDSNAGGSRNWGKKNLVRKGMLISNHPDRRCTVENV